MYESTQFGISTLKPAVLLYHIAVPSYNLFPVLESRRILHRDGGDTFSLQLVPDIVKRTCQRDNKDKLGDHGRHI